MAQDNTPPFLFGPSAWRPLARGLRAYHEGDQRATLTVHSDAGPPEEMPVSVFFRTAPSKLRSVDREALRRARGRVLDGGAGVGSLALVLQERAVEVAAVEVVPEAAEIMRSRGVREVVEGRLEDLPADHCYDTVLLLMNGTALAGTLAGLPRFLEVLKGVLAPGGQLLLDSTDLTSRGEGDGGGGMPRTAKGAPQTAKGEPGAEEGGYPGELHYQLEFRGEKGAPFPQLFVDPGTLAAVAGEGGWITDILLRDPTGEFLARLTLDS